MKIYKDKKGNERVSIGCYVKLHNYQKLIELAKTENKSVSSKIESILDDYIKIACEASEEG